MRKNNGTYRRRVANPTANQHRRAQDLATAGRQLRSVPQPVVGGALTLWAIGHCHVWWQHSVAAFGRGIAVHTATIESTSFALIPVIRPRRQEDPSTSACGYIILCLVVISWALNAPRRCAGGGGWRRRWIVGLGRCTCHGARATFTGGHPGPLCLPSSIGNNRKREQRTAAH